mgnify:CR=1 FL=1
MGAQHQHDLPVHSAAGAPSARCGGAAPRRRTARSARWLPSGTVSRSAAAGKPAADGERQRAPLAGDERGADVSTADDGAGIRAGDRGRRGRRPRASDRPRRSCSRNAARRLPNVSGTAERQRQDDGRSWKARRSKIRMWRNRRIAHQHRGQQRHDGELEHQGREEELVRRRECGVPLLGIVARQDVMIERFRPGELDDSVRSSRALPRPSSTSSASPSR